MSSAHADRNAFLRYSVGLAGVLLISFALSVLLGIKPTIQLWTLSAAFTVGVTLLFLYLLYRLVLANERIADQL